MTGPSRAGVFQIFPPTPNTMKYLDLVCAEQGAYYGQHNHHVIAYYQHTLKGKQNG